MDLVPFRPLNLLSRWPDVWDEDDFGLLNSGSNNLDVYETADQVVVKANVAGVKADDIDLTYEKGILWIQAEHQKEESDEDKKHYSKSSWNYSYKIAVPGRIDLEKEPDAEVKDGVLTVSFQKAESSKPRKLKIKAS